MSCNVGNNSSWCEEYSNCKDCVHYECDIEWSDIPDDYDEELENEDLDFNDEVYQDGISYRIYNYNRIDENMVNALIDKVLSFKDGKTIDNAYTMWRNLMQYNDLDDWQDNCIWANVYFPSIFDEYEYEHSYLFTDKEWIKMFEVIYSVDGNEILNRFRRRFINECKLKKDIEYLKCNYKTEQEKISEKLLFENLFI